MSLAPHVLVTEPLADRTTGHAVALDPARAHHLRRVLRLSDGALLSLTDGLGMQAVAQLDGDHARLAADADGVAPQGPRLVLLQALSKGRRAEDAVRTACELGVDRLVPVVADRTQGRPDARAADAVLERWRSVAVAALEQSRGVRLAEVAGPVPTRTLASEPAGPDTVRLVAVPGALPLPGVLAAAVLDAGSAPTEVAVAIGPEGGWSAEEVEVLVAAGWSPVGLGPTVLRTEHAGPVAIAVIAAAVGRWGDGTGAPSGAVDAPATPRRATVG